MFLLTPPKCYNSYMKSRQNYLIVSLVTLVAILGVLMFVIDKKSISPDVATIASGGQMSTTTQISTSTTKTVSTISSPEFHYIEIINGCGPYYNLTPCVNMRSGPGTQYPIVDRLRTGIVLKAQSTTTSEGYEWYKIMIDKSILYPERVTGDWYVAADPKSVQPFENVGDEWLTSKSATTTKRIVIDLSQEMLYAYDGETLFMQNSISTGLEFTPTPVGTFKVFKKTPSRYMQGPIVGLSDQYYDLPGVPWNLYFTNDGSVIHGAYWHDHFGQPWSHGCVNLPPEKAKELYLWADIGTAVIVKN